MDRINTVDAFKLLAIVGVIIIHAVPFEFSLQQDSGLFHPAIFFNQLSRFAVPLFFIFSGYFLGKKLQNEKQPDRVLISIFKKTALIFIFWSFIYLMPLNANLIARDGVATTLRLTFHQAVSLLGKPFTVGFEGTAGHLWFLSSLLICLVSSWIFILKNRTHALLGCALVLYTFGLSAKAYAATPLGLHIEFNTRNGPFFGLLFFASGLLLSNKTPTARWFLTGMILLALGYFLHFSEVYFLNKYYGSSLFQDYVVGTYLIGLGMAMVALSGHRSTNFDAFGRAGKFALGIYGVHVIFLVNFYPIKKMMNSHFFDIGYIFVILLVSLITVFLMSRMPTVRKFVM